MTFLKDNVVLVTGGGSGLGAGVARHFLTQGAQLAIMDISGEKLEALHAEFGDGVLLVQGDVARLADVQACRAAVEKRFGRLDALVGAQGIWDGYVRLRNTPLDKIDAAFDELFHVNVKGYILTARVMLDLLEASQGAIVLTGSSGASFCADGGGVFYTATKHAVVGVVRQLSFEFAPKVRVNGVAPCLIDGSHLRGPRSLGLEKQSQADLPKEVFEEFAKAAPLQWLPHGEDYGPMYALLASRHSRVMTGQMVYADQGLENRNVMTPLSAGGAA